MRENARRASCSSNEKQLGLAFIQYQQDSDEQFPCGVANGGGSASGTTGAGWASQIYSYAKSQGVYQCPDDSTAKPEVSYFYNMNFNWTGNGYNNGGRYLALAKFTAPASTVLLAECTGITDDPSSESDAGNASATSWGVDYLFCSQGGHQAFATATISLATGVMGNSPGSAPLEYKSATGRHSDGSNFLLCDGHVKWLRGSAVSSGTASDAATANVTASPTQAPTSSSGANNTAAGTAYPGYAATFNPV